jgi:exosortase C (VPDSG-CTERM-specific)
VNPELSSRDTPPVVLTVARVGEYWRRLPRAVRVRIGAYCAYVAALALLFAQPLIGLTRLAVRHDLHSHIVLIPFVSFYLLWIQRGRLPAGCGSSVVGAAISATAAIGLLGAQRVWQSTLSVNDELAVAAIALVCCVFAGCFLFFGSAWVRAAAFPLSFLVFSVPLPDSAVAWLEEASMLASADVTALYFKLSGTPFAREGTLFALPGIALRVAEECSGIRSSWVLFITSVLLSHVFLRTTWRRVVLVLFVIPLGILRNGFRIMVIGLLCVHMGPEMLDSMIHRRGGPLFFVLSLAPLLLLLLFLRRYDKKRIAGA